MTQSRNAVTFRVAGIALACVPALSALLYVAFNSYFTHETAFQKAQARNAIIQRSNLIRFEHDRMIGDLESALNEADAQNVRALIQRAIPTGERWQVIPLDDMGIASLEPSDYGLDSLALLDRVSRTFDSGISAVEVIHRDARVDLAVTSRFVAGQTQGVAVAIVRADTLAHWVSPSAMGQFAVWHQFDGVPQTLVVGSGLSSQPRYEAAVEGTPFTVSLSIDERFVSTAPVIPVGFWFAILGGLLSSFWVLHSLSRKRLRADTQRILETESSRQSPTLHHSELQPLAAAFRQLDANGQRRLRQRTPIKVNAITGPANFDVAPESDVDVPPVQSAQSPWLSEKSSWVYLPKESTYQQENDAVSQLAAGIAGLSRRSSTRSFVVSFMGDEAVGRSKTHFIKSLLVEGVDVVDVGQVPPPIAHLATHNGTTSGAGLILHRNASGQLGVGALYNRQWAGSGFWQKVLLLLNETAEPSANGRSIALDLSNEYCERVGDDMAMAQSMRVVVFSDSAVTLDLLQKSLERANCHVFPQHQDTDISREHMASAIRQHEANMGVIVDEMGSRMRVFDDNASEIEGHKLYMLMSQDALSRHPGFDVVAGPKASRALPSFITSCGGSFRITASTPNLMQREMTRSGALVGGDCDGTLYLRDRWLGSDDAIYATARVVELISNEGRLSDLAARLPQTSLRVYPLESAAPRAALWELLCYEGNFSGSRIEHVDGVRVNFADCWVYMNEPSSGDEPTIWFEGDDIRCCDRLEDLIKELFCQKHPELEIPFH